MMKAGTYFIGDLCYVFDSNEWSYVCSLVISAKECLEGEFTLPDGRKFAMFNTMYGDGCYSDQLGNQYPVDSGSIGCILAKDIDLSKCNNVYGCGAIIDIKNDFTPSSKNGKMVFDHICIDTSLEEDDECEYEYNECEYDD